MACKLRTVIFSHGHVCSENRYDSFDKTHVHLWATLSNFSLPDSLNDPSRSQKLVGPSEALTKRCINRGRCGSNAMSCEQSQKRECPQTNARREQRAHHQQACLPLPHSLHEPPVSNLSEALFTHRPFPGKETLTFLRLGTKVSENDGPSPLWGKTNKAQLGFPCGFVKLEARLSPSACTANRSGCP